MSSELLSRTQNREAIGRGLSPYMNENSLQRVLNYWEDEYGDQPPFVLNKFLTEICNTDELRFFKKDILKKMEELDASNLEIINLKVYLCFQTNYTTTVIAELKHKVI